MGDSFWMAYFGMAGGIAFIMTVVVILDKIAQRQNRKKRERELDADGTSIRA